MGTWARLPLWKKTVLVGCASYFLFFWILPIALVPAVTILPFVHESDRLERLTVSIIASAIVFLCLLWVSPWRKSILRSPSHSGSTLESLKHWLGMSLGLMLFTWCSVELSANSFGFLARILPATAYTQTVVVQDADRHGSRLRSVSLKLKTDSGSYIYLELSERLFSSVNPRPGDRLALHGRRTVIGDYVASVSFI